MPDIAGLVCKSCGSKLFPRHACCPSCKATEFGSSLIGGTATLLTFTRVHMLSLAYMERYITLGIVEFEGGFRALGRLFVDEPKIGMKLTTEIGTVRVQDGTPIKGFCFREIRK